MLHHEHQRIRAIIILIVIVLCAFVFISCNHIKLDYDVVDIRDNTESYREIDWDAFNFLDSWVTDAFDNFDVPNGVRTIIRDNPSDYSVFEIRVNVYNPHVYNVWQAKIRAKRHNTEGVWFEKRTIPVTDSFASRILSKSYNTEYYIECIVSNQLKDRFDVDFINENFSFSVKGKFYPSFARYQLTQ